MNPIRELCKALVILCLHESRYTVGEFFTRSDTFWLGPNQATVTVKIEAVRTPLVEELEQEVHGR